MQEGDKYRHPVWVLLCMDSYRTLWIAVLFSYVGGAMYDIGASWLMVSLTPNPLLVSLITTATTLSIFQFALSSGTIFGIFDRVNILFIACAYMFTD